MAVWQPIASMVTMQPSSASSRSRRGMAVISLDFASVATCPSTSPLAVAQALTRCSGRLARPRDRASGAASCRRWPPPRPRPAAPTTRLHPGQEAAPGTAAGSSRANTRPKVSCDGMPFGSARNVRSQASLRGRTSRPPPSRRPRRSPRTARSSGCRATVRRCARRAGPQRGKMHRELVRTPLHRRPTGPARVGRQYPPPRRAPTFRTL